jgi:hypothetical protein
VFEDLESGVSYGRFVPDESGGTDEEFEIGYLQALEDILMNRVQVYSLIGML